MAEAKLQNTFLLELVSPERVLSSEEVEFAVLPAMEGGIGVLPGHSPFLTALKPGVIEIHKKRDQEVRKIFVAGGFVDITPTVCTTLAVGAVPVSELNQATVEKKIEEIQKELTETQNSDEFQRVEERLLTEKAKLQAITGKLVA